MKRPAMVWVLVGLLWFLGLGGLYGGVLMLLDPSGHLIQMHSVLHLLRVPDFFLPGLFLFFVMGLVPLILSIALIKRPQWHGIESLLPLKTYHWAWTSTLSLCIVLSGWLGLQGILIGFHWPIQFIIAGTNLLMLVLVLKPDIKQYYIQNNQLDA